MDLQARENELFEILSDLDKQTQKLLAPLVKNVAFLEKRLDELSALPQIEIHPTNPQKQRPTTAAKQYKECSQSYMNAVRILLGVLNKLEVDAADELQKKLFEFR